MSFFFRGAKAPNDAQYVSLVTHNQLPYERVLTAGTGIGIVDSGAGAAITISANAGEIDHDALINFVENKHIDWTSASDNFLTSGTLGVGKITVTGVEEGLKLIGIATGNANKCHIGFYDSNGSTRRGYVGDASSGNDDIYLVAETGYLRLLAAGYISLGTHTYFPDDVVMSFGASLDYSIGYANATDTLQIVDGTTLGSNVRLKLDSSGHFDFGAGNLTTTGTLGSGALTLSTIAAGASDYDKFLVSDSGLVKYRTGAEVLGDIGGLANIVEDTTPQLGGDLDLNSQNIDFPSTANISDVKDEDNMASDSATMLATQQSIKAYVDTTAGFLWAIVFGGM